jgi:hypothetical protein
MYNKFGHFIRSIENGKKPVITNTDFVVCFRNWNCDCPHIVGNVSETKLRLKINSGKGKRFSE